MVQQFAADRYERMTYRRCGASGLALPAISLGAWTTFGGYRDEPTARRCLYRAFDLGVTHIDLANNYGEPPGNAEVVIGRILRDMPRDELIVSTKAGYYMWPGPYGDGLSKKYLVASLDQSLQRLGLDYVDIYYAHRPDPDTPLEESLAALELIVRKGKALYIGISNYYGEQFEAAVRTARRLGLSPITITQPRYNLLDRRCEGELLEAARREGVGVIAFSPLASGLLTDKYLSGEPPSDSRAALLWSADETAQRLTPETMQRLQRLHALAQARGQSLAQMALAWVLRHPGMTSALIGASRVEQIEENVAALQNPAFDDQELAAIDAATR